MNVFVLLITLIKFGLGGPLYWCFFTCLAHVLAHRLVALSYQLLFMAHLGMFTYFPKDPYHPWELLNLHDLFKWS